MSFLVETILSRLTSKGLFSTDPIFMTEETREVPLTSIRQAIKLGRSLKGQSPGSQEAPVDHKGQNSTESLSADLITMLSRNDRGYLCV